MNQKFLTPHSKSITARRNWHNRQTRRHGSVLVYVALGLTVFIGTAALSVDMGNLYGRKAKSQLAADAAALAGAYEMANFRSSNANTAARNAAGANGYVSDPNAPNYQPGVTVIITNPVPSQPKQFRAKVSRNEPLFFARIFGLPSRPVTSTATAEYETLSPLSTSGGGGNYGQPDGPTNLSLFGPDARYDYGDFRSAKYLLNGQANPDYTGKGYNFTVNVPSSYTDTVLEIFDPDCHNNGGRFVQAGVRIDELRKPYNQNQSDAIVPSDITTTRYTLYHDPKGNGDPSQLQLIDEKTFGDDVTTDMTWDPTFTFNRANYAGGSFLLNVTTISGASENAFVLRARPAGVAFDPQNGTSISGDGFLPMNFNASGNSTIELGNVPVDAAGHQLSIRKFDTDVGSLNVDYTYKAPDGTVSAPIRGQLSTNGTFYTDLISLPLSYPGGTWSATYTAGANDTSVWEMSYTGGSAGKPGEIKLVE